MACEVKLQSDRFPDVELIVTVDSGIITSGAKRQALTDSARGDYIAFVDDDDEISANYVADLRAGCQSGAAVVTFRMDQSNDGISQNVQRFSVCAADGTHDADGIVVMQANHLCAWRREVATSIAWDPGLGYGDDQLWYKSIHAMGGYREHHIPSVLYFYRWSAAGTANQRGWMIEHAQRLYAGGAELFRAPQHGVCIGIYGADAVAGWEKIPVRDCRNRVYWIIRNDARSLANIKIR